MEKVAQVGVKKERGFLYFVDKEGDISQTKRGEFSSKKVASVGIKKESGYLYFVDKQGDISRAKMARRKAKAE